MSTTPPTENDGPAGAVAISRILQGLGKKVYVITDHDNVDVIKATVAASDRVYGASNDAQSQVQLLSYPEGDIDASSIIAQYGLDYLVAIERCGPAEDGMCYTMVGRNLNLTQRIARLEQLFTCR